MSVENVFLVHEALELKAIANFSGNGKILQYIWMKKKIQIKNTGVYTHHIFLDVSSMIHELDDLQLLLFWLESLPHYDFDNTSRTSGHRHRLNVPHRL